MARRANTRFTVWTALLLLLWTAATACAAEKTVITHLHYSAHGQGWTDWLNAMAKDYMAANPNVQIDILPTTSGEYGTKMRTMFAADAGLDIIEVGLGAVQYDDEGLLLNLRPFIERDKVLDQWPKPVLDSFTYQGRIWGIPASIDLWMTWFNRDLFDKAGVVDPNGLGSNWNWDYLVSAGKKMTLDNNADGIIDQYGVDRAHQLWSYDLAAVAAGANLFERRALPTQPNVNSPEAKRALRWVADLFLAHRITQPYNDPNISKFYMWTGNSAISPGDNTGVARQFKDATFNWDVAPPLTGPAGSYTNMQMMGLEVMSNTKNPEAVWQWLKFLLVRRDSVERFVSLTARVPAFKGAQSKYNQLIPYAPKSWPLIFETLGRSTTMPSWVYNIPGMTEHRSSAVLAQVFTGQKAPEQALDEAQAKIVANVKAYFDSKAQQGKK